ncbi:hypothetical protein [Streptomyces sp. NPDC052292]|uniref:LGFP repeat-containing protein n=1 Tax=Streptomyces sp. NPDC052292 TaxID=3155053 RepID=UPI00343D3106
MNRRPNPPRSGPAEHRSRPYAAVADSLTPDGVGRYNHFENGSIYWTPETGAWEVHGAIRDKWASMGWERSQVGYSTSDEHGPSNRRSNKFQHGTYLTWTPTDGVVLETSYGDDYEQNPV